MSNSLRAVILAEIRSRAENNGGRAPGQRAFEAETGITRSSWRGKYWATWTDALREAGIRPNFAPQRASEADILSFLAGAVRHFGRFPSDSEIRIYRQSIASAPAIVTIRKQFSTRSEMISALAGLSKTNDEFSDLFELLPEIPDENHELPADVISGWVYLLKSGQHYKIGRSDNVERRIKQITIALPETATLIHAIQTDDAIGIEKYWHERFLSQRANGEWFSLKPKDVSAFRRRKFM